MKKYILNILFLTICVSISAAEPEALLLNEGALHSVLLDDVQRITFSSSDELLLKTTAGSETAFAIDDISKITFGDMITTALPPVVKTDNYTSLPANIVGYYNIVGQRLPQEPEKGLYIIRYDNGTAEKRMK